MFKYVLAIIVLLVTDLISYNYLMVIASDRYPYRFSPNGEALIFQKKPIILNDTKDFDFDTYFSILSFKDTAYRYEFIDDLLVIDLENRKYRFSYTIIEPIIETVEKVVYKEVYIKETVQESVSEEKEEGPQMEEEYFRLRKDHIYFQKGEDISSIIPVLKDLVDTNMQVTIDYSSLDPNRNGQYSVFFITKEGRTQLTVEIR